MQKRDLDMSGLSSNSSGHEGSSWIVDIMDWDLYDDHDDWACAGEPT